MTNPDDIGARLKATHAVAKAAKDAHTAAVRERHEAIMVARRAGWTYRQIAPYLGLKTHQSVIRIVQNYQGANPRGYRNHRARLERARAAEKKNQAEGQGGEAV